MYRTTTEYESSKILQGRPISYYGIKKQLLGEGSFAKVYRYVKNDQKEYAIKIFSQDKIIDSLREISILIRCQHPLIVSIEDVIMIRGSYAIVTEYLQGTNLKIYMEKRDELTRNDILHIITQIVEVIAYLHSRDIIHKDLKEENIMINPTTKQIKLIDFGFSRGNYCSSQEQGKWGQGSPLYASPEDMLGYVGYDTSKDIWSLGVIISLMVSSYTNFVDFKGLKRTLDNLFERIFDTFGPITLEDTLSVPQYKEIRLERSKEHDPFDREQYYKSIRNDLKDLIPILDEIFVLNPSKRISAAQILKREPISLFRRLPEEPERSCVQILRMRDSYPSIVSLGDFLSDKEVENISFNEDIVEKAYFKLFLYNFNMGYKVKVFQLTCWMFDSMFMKYLGTTENPRRIYDTLSCCYYISCVLNNVKIIDFYKVDDSVSNLSDNMDNIKEIIRSLNYDLFQTTSANYSDSMDSLYECLSCIIYIVGEEKYNLSAEELNSIVNSSYKKILSPYKVPLNDKERSFLTSAFSLLLNYTSLTFKLENQFIELNTKLYVLLNQ